jgi:hypothetical protein
VRIIGLDIHRALAEAVAWDDGKLKRLGRVDMRRRLLTAFAKKLSKKDIVVVEATGNASSIAAACRAPGARAHLQPHRPDADSPPRRGFAGPSSAGRRVVREAAECVDQSYGGSVLFARRNALHRSCSQASRTRDRDSVLPLKRLPFSGSLAASDSDWFRIRSRRMPFYRGAPTGQLQTDESGPALEGFRLLARAHAGLRLLVPRF